MQITVTGLMSAKNRTTKIWGKVLSGIDPSQRGGYAFQGEWVKKDHPICTANLSDGSDVLILFCVERKHTRYFLIRTGGEKAAAFRVSEWEAIAEGAGQVLYNGDDITKAREAAIAAGCPIVKTSAPEQTVRVPRYARSVGVCGYTGKPRTNPNLCEHCGDDC
jgi:hypothetical protein